MGIDYEAIVKRLEGRKLIAEILSAQIHPWELGFDKTSRWLIYVDRNTINDISQRYDIRSRFTVGIGMPYEWIKSTMNPLIFFTGLLRGDLDTSKLRLHGTLCSKCNALRAMRRKAPKRILPEESSGS